MQVYAVAGNRFYIEITDEFPEIDKMHWVIEQGHILNVDQILEVTQKQPLSFEVWNRDGSRAEMCGNGALSVVRWASHKGPIDKRGSIFISGKEYAYTWNGETAAIQLPIPEIDKSSSVQFDDQDIEYVPVRVPNPHAVVFYGCDYLFCNQQIDESQIQNFSRKISEAQVFQPEGTNVQMVKMDQADDEIVRLCVTPWERGAGPTKACGSGAVAAAYAYYKRAQCKQKKFQVEMPGGRLLVEIFSEFVCLAGVPKVFR